MNTIKLLKPIKDLRKGEIIHTAYGSPDNWGDFIFDSYEVEGRYVKINFYWDSKSKEIEAMYHYGKETDEIQVVEVIE